MVDVILKWQVKRVIDENGFSKTHQDIASFLARSACSDQVSKFSLSELWTVVASESLWYPMSSEGWLEDIDDRL